MPIKNKWPNLWKIIEKIHKNITCSLMTVAASLMCTWSVQELEKRKVYKLLIPKLERWASWDPWWAPHHLGLHRRWQFKNKNNKEKKKEQLILQKLENFLQTLKGKEEERRRVERRLRFRAVVILKQKSSNNCKERGLTNTAF